jgi:hypothetical protein
VDIHSLWEKVIDRISKKGSVLFQISIFVFNKYYMFYSRYFSMAISMSRTEKDIIAGRRIEEVKTVVLKWFGENKVKVMVNTPDFVFGRWGTGFLTASKFFQVTLVPTEGGVIAKTEGWVTGVTGLPGAIISLPEQDFNASSFFYGGIPRKEGMKAIERLWNTLESLSPQKTQNES